MSASIEPIPLVKLIHAYRDGVWGFTGTRAGMTEFQGTMIERIYRRGQPVIVRHGGAWGSDAQMHLVWKRKCKESVAYVFPADEKRAALYRQEDPHRVRVQAVRPPLERNPLIVEESTLLIATPHKEHEEQRSGTWATIRCAARQNLPVLIIWPRSQKITFFHDKTLQPVSYTVGVAR